MEDLEYKPNNFLDSRIESPRPHGSARRIIPVGKAKPIYEIAVIDSLAITRIRVFIQNVFLRVTSLIQNRDGSYTFVEVLKPMLLYMLLIICTPKKDSNSLG
jgi:hypothetical protein